MKLISVQCDKCGARLNLPGDQNMVTCRICSSTIIIQSKSKRRSKESFTPEQVAEFQLELEQLDYQWKRTCEQNRYNTMYTDTTKVSQTDSVVLGIVGPAIGILWIVLLDYWEISSYFLTGMGVAFILFTLHASATFTERKTKYKEQFEDYSLRRMRLVSLIAMAEETPRREEPKPERKATREPNPFIEESPTSGKLSWSV